MEDEIQVKVKKLRTDLKMLDIAITQFEPYSKDFTQKALEKLEGGQNADFIENMKYILCNMTDTKAPELLKEIKEFHDDAIKLVDTFETTDNNLAKQQTLGK
ncbi:hypothetical protein NNC19_18535 [Clostridium sp. SHJSY1]|uniref:hypothetical protein n=1 Tax=Clostridium sp. SHJSY1 TaxID=2942483 RepID=UPI0028752578|nr:hypothetical protein [Clostridium sp. SHJSY1]MDS0527690.1 hypothetical protein [Clostridium sp. SHJSY1]